MMRDEREKLAITLEEEISQSAEELWFENAAKLRDEIKGIRRDMAAFPEASGVGSPGSG